MFILKKKIIIINCSYSEILKFRILENFKQGNILWSRNVEIIQHIM